MALLSFSPRIVNICRCDYANFAYHNAMALKSIGVNSDSFCLESHPFNYDKHALVVPADVMKEQIRSADIVQIFHNDKQIFDWCVNIQALPGHSHLRIVPYHSCSAYRNDPLWYQHNWNPHVDVIMSNQCEFFMDKKMASGVKNGAHYITHSIDTEKYISKYLIENKQHTKTSEEFIPIIAHYPSNPSVKGTEQICEMMRDIRGNYRFACDTAQVSYQDQLKRMSECDIYIELFNPVLNGQPYGCYGVTAFEAATMGKIVVTQNVYREIYESEYGECLLQICNTKEEFISTVKRLIEMPYNELKSLGENTRKWAIENHSYQATGKRICTILNHKNDIMNC